MLKKLLPILIACLLVVSAVGWRVWYNSASGDKKARSKAAPVVSTERLRRRTLEAFFKSVGSVESPQRVELTPKMQGVVEYLQVHPGDKVQRGQVLVRLDGAELQDEVNKCRAELAQAQAHLAQARLTQASNDASVASGLRQQHAAVATAQAELDMVRESSAAATAEARATVDNAAAEAENALVKYQREQELYRQAFTAVQDVDDARTQHQVRQGQLSAAREVLKATQAKAKADVKVAEAKLVQAQAALDHAQAETSQLPAYRQNLTALEAVVSAAQAALDSARTRLSQTILTSPLDGYVTARNLDPGSLAKAGQAILTLQSTKVLWVIVAVPSEVRDLLTVNSLVTVQAHQGAAYPAQILQINAAASEEDRQFQVRILLPAGMGASPGEFLTARFITEQHVQVLALPKAALITRPHQTAVAVLQPDLTVKICPVTTGFADANYVEILSGLHENEPVVTLSSSELTDGQKVKLADSVGLSAKTVEKSRSK